MDNAFYSTISSLPVWAVFILALLLVTSPLIMEIIRSVRKKKEEDSLISLIKEMRESSEENQVFVSSFKNYIEELYTKLDILLDLLYERYANNLSHDMANKIIELVYERTYFRILNLITEFSSSDRKYDEGGLKVSCIKSEIESLIRSRYYMDMMTLNKVTCKGISLNMHLVALDPDIVINDIVRHLEENKEKRSWDMYLTTKKFLEAYFQTLINKAQFKLEENIKEKV